MEPIEFVGQNFQIGAPADMKDRCDPLMLHVDEVEGDRRMISCWQMSSEELQELQRNGGRVYLTIIGHGHPPVVLDVVRPF